MRSLLLNSSRAILAILTLSFSALAGTITLTGAIDGEPVSAKADYLFNGNQLTVTVTNLKDDPNSVKQVITGIDFSIVGNLAYTLLSATGTLISIDSTGAVTSTTAGANLTNWVKTGTKTTVIGGGQPEQGIIGNGTGSPAYVGSNGSIKGNAPHNPFTLQSATFVYQVTGGTSNSAIQSFAFGFNTTGNQYLPGTINQSAVPEPSTCMLLGTGLLAAGFRVWRRKPECR